MRSSKKRSRSSQNRPRTLGNIINRVFDSSGPEGKVRGTPQQIIEKYQMLARDAQLSNDRVATENFLQHAEHYTRMLAEAVREMGAEQEARQQYQQQNVDRNGGQNGGQNGGHNAGHNGGQNGGQNGQGRADRPHDRQPDRQPDRQHDRGFDRGERRSDANREPRDDRDPSATATAPTAEVIDLGAGDRSDLIETPEAVTMPAQRQRREPQAEQQPVDSAEQPQPDRAPRRARGPRRPKSDDQPQPDPSQDATAE